MKYSELFPKARKVEFKEDLSVNAKLLTKAGFIDQLMAGSYTLLPLGLRVVEKIKDIIRIELNETGAQELLMPLLHPRELWDTTGRWSDPDVKQIMYQFKDIHGKEYGLSFTHEEIMMNLLGKHISSYKDLPTKLYHFSTKFRNEPRAKSGILRAREFMMKDLYSAHVTEADMEKYYALVKDAYVRIFNKMGLQVKVAEASGGVFTQKHSHEFQVISDVGEDTIFYCDCSDKSCDCRFAQNKEIFSGSDGDKCPDCDDCTIKSASSIEVGNIFPLGTKYSKDQQVFYKDKEGQQREIWFASYGIGPTRVMGTLVEVYNDDKGIIWPASVAPFDVHLINLKKDTKESDIVYQELLDLGFEVLYDERLEASAGEKLSNADLIGIPFRLVVSEKAGDKVEVKKRNEEEVRLVDRKDLEKLLK